MAQKPRNFDKPQYCFLQFVKIQFTDLNVHVDVVRKLWIVMKIYVSP